MKTSRQTCIRCEKFFTLPNKASEKMLNAPLCPECEKAIEPPRTRSTTGIRETDARDKARP